MKSLSGFVLLAATLVLLTACAPKITTPYTPVGTKDISSKVAGGEYRERVDNFLLVLDASSSMAQPYTMGSRYQVAQGLAGNLNATLPELDWQAGLRFFGPRFVDTGRTVLAYGMTTHNRADLAAALNVVEEPSGTTPMGTALRRAGEDLAGTSGRTALVLFSDGEVESDCDVLGVVAELHDRFDGKLCLYPVLVGDSAAGAALMEKIVEKSACGMVTRASELLSAEAMAAFATKVFLEQAPARAPVAVAPIVQEQAEPVYRTEARRLEVNFAFDKAEIRPADHADLARFAEFLKAHPEIGAVEIAGHTCNMGPAGYNQGLSQRRAESVVKYLVDKLGVDSQRLSAKGYGLSKPLASNDTLAGRQQNRRVEAVVTTLVEQK